MREIQDMTLNVSRGIERLERRLLETCENASDKSSSALKPPRMHGVSD